MGKRKTIQNVESRYFEGTIPIEDTKWKVFTVSKDKIVYVGEVFVSGKVVVQEMRSHTSIKGYEPSDIAKRIAHQKFKNVNPVIVERIWEE